MGEVSFAAQPEIPSTLRLPQARSDNGVPFSVSDQESGTARDLQLEVP
jgi:hypothetical protein